MFTLIAHGHTSVYRRTLTSARRRVQRIHSRRQMADAVDAFHPSVAHRQLERDVEYSAILRFAQHHFVYNISNGTLCVCAPWIIVNHEQSVRHSSVFHFRHARGGIDAISLVLVETAPPSWASDRLRKKSRHRKHVWADRRRGCERRVRVRNSKAVMSSPLGFRISHRPMSKACTHRERRASGASGQCSRW